MKRRKKSDVFILSCLAEEVANAVQDTDAEFRPRERHVGYLEGKLVGLRMANFLTDQEYEDFFNQLVVAGLTERFSYQSLYSTDTG